MASWWQQRSTKNSRRDTTRCDACGYKWNYAWRSQCKQCGAAIRASIPAVATEATIEWPQQNDQKALDAKVKLNADTIARYRQNGYKDDHPTLAAALEDAKQLRQEKVDEKGFWAQQQSHSGKIVSKQNKLAKQKAYLRGLQDQQQQLETKIQEAEKEVADSAKEINELEEEAKAVITAETPVLPWVMPDLCSADLKAQYAELEQTQKNFNMQMENLRQRSINEETIRKNRAEAADLARATREAAPEGPAGPSSAPAPMETDHLAQHLGKEEFAPFFKENLAEGSDVEKFKKHFLEMVQANEAKRRKQG